MVNAETTVCASRRTLYVNAGSNPAGETRLLVEILITLGKYDASGNLDVGEPERFLQNWAG